MTHARITTVEHRNRHRPPHAEQLPPGMRHGSGSRRNPRKRGKRSDAPGVERWPVYEQAHFYIQELDRRHDSWVSRRDLFLEIVVIRLIGLEVWFAIVQGTQQAKEFEQEQQVMTNLEQSSASTAEILTALETTLDLNGLDSRQPLKHLPVSVDVNYNPDAQTLVVTNLGESKIEVLGYQFDHDVHVYDATSLHPNGWVFSCLMRAYLDRVYVGTFWEVDSYQQRRQAHHASGKGNLKTKVVFRVLRARWMQQWRPCLL
jgi:hypothetical protein